MANYVDVKLLFVVEIKASILIFVKYLQKGSFCINFSS